MDPVVITEVDLMIYECMCVQTLMSVRTELTTATDAQPVLILMAPTSASVHMVLPGLA